MKAESMRWMAAIIMVTTYMGLIVLRPENAGIILDNSSNNYGDNTGNGNTAKRRKRKRTGKNSKEELEDNSKFYSTFYST